MTEHFYKLCAMSQVDLKEVSAIGDPPAWKRKILKAYQINTCKKAYGYRLIFFPNLLLTDTKPIDNFIKFIAMFGIGNDDWPVERKIVRELFAKCVQFDDKNGRFRPFSGEVNSGRLASNHGFPLA